MSDVSFSTEAVESPDVTLELSRVSSPKVIARQKAAWKRFAGPQDLCPFCRHSGADHMWSSQQPYFFRPATEEESGGAGRLYVHVDYGLLKRLTVAKGAEVLQVYCGACAEEKATGQVVCFIRTWGIGEVVGAEASGD